MLHTAFEDMSEVIIRKAKETDFAGILQLQNANLISNLPESERGDGFVTTQFTQEMLAALNQQTGVFLACTAERVVGYAMTGTLDFFHRFPLILYMNSRLQNTIFDGKLIDTASALQYGPVCIEKNFRGQGVLVSLFEQICTQLSSKFEVGVTFISTVNSRSYQAHVRKLGMTVVDEFDFTGKNYYTLAFSIKSATF